MIRYKGIIEGTEYSMNMMIMTIEISVGKKEKKYDFWRNRKGYGS